jgi:hypothetical protein
VGSESKDERAIGLWLLYEKHPYAAIGIYKGILSEDEKIEAVCKSALIAIQPIYESYIPRLKVRYRETAQQEEFDKYIANLAGWLAAEAGVKLGESKLKRGPMSPGFFDFSEADNRTE